MEFSRSEKLRPLVGVIGTKDPKISLNFLIDLFSLSICLRVICGGEIYIIILDDSSKFSSKSRSKLRTTIRDNNVMKSKVFEYMIKKELGKSICLNSFETRG